MKRILCCLLTVCLIAAVFAACSDKKDDTAAKDEAVSGETSETATEKPIEVYEIETKYCTLKYPKEWKDKVNVMIDDSDVYTVRFACGKVKLFDLTFNGGDGYTLGTVIGKDENIVVRLMSYDIDKKAKNYEELNAMSGSVNVIIEHLNADYTFEKTDESEDDSNSVFEIKTSLTTLYYPQKWEDSVTIISEDNAVYFSCGNTKLFDLLFDSDKGDFLGSYDGTDISVVSYDIKKGKLSDEEYTNLLGMQDGLNVILGYLDKDKLFTRS